MTDATITWGHEHPGGLKIRAELEALGLPFVRVITYGHERHVRITVHCDTFADSMDWHAYLCQRFQRSKMEVAWLSPNELASECWCLHTHALGDQVLQV